MVKVSLEIKKKDLFGLSLLIVLLSGGLVVAFNSGYSGGDPPVFGHSADELFIRGDTSMQVWADSVEGRLDASSGVASVGACREIKSVIWGYTMNTCASDEFMNGFLCNNRHDSGCQYYTIKCCKLS